MGAPSFQRYQYKLQIDCRLLKYDAKENLSILTSVLTMLTGIQPLVCIHAVIIWSQGRYSIAQLKTQ